MFLGLTNLGLVAQRPLDAVIRALFAQGQQGVWYDPSDFSTMFQDSAGTTPVTAVGQPVGKLLDKSGRGNHAIQATAANRPTLQQDANGLYYLAFNGTNSSMATAASVDFTATAQMTVWAGVYKASDATVAMLAELSANAGTSSGAIWLAAPVTTNPVGRNSFLSRGTASAETYADVAAPAASVFCGVADIANAISRIRVNGAQASQSAVSQGTGNFGSYPAYIGARAGTSLFFNGRLYSLIVRGASSSAAEIASTESWVNGKTRAY